MGLGGFFKKLFGKGEPEVAAAQTPPAGVPAAVNSVGTGMPGVPVANPVTPPSATAEKTA